MSTRDLLLMELYHTPRDPQIRALAARHAPMICFDTHEPFLPLAAGYTLFGEDGPSYSMDRIVSLSPEGKPPAALAIEYAIWWDWDIHHLYELEHVWVYLDSNEQPVRVEASWHGEYNDIPLKLQDGHVVVLSEPGKHAFAPDPAWFHKRMQPYRRLDTEQVGMQSHVLINSMFRGKIRERVFDSTLTRSFLSRHTFTPAWQFDKRFTLQPEQLVPWPVLLAWIPQRVNATLERLESNIRPENYRPLHIRQTDGTPASMKRSAHCGADALLVPITSTSEGRLVLAGDLSVDMPDIFRFCKSEPMAAFLAVDSVETAERTGRFLAKKKMQGYAVITSADPAHLAAYHQAAPGGISALMLSAANHEALQVIEESGPRYVLLEWNDADRTGLSQEWIRSVQAAGAGVISWSVSTEEEASHLSRMGIDGILFPPPAGV